MTLRLLSYNIRFGGAGREAALAATIRAARPDVVVLQEATRPEVVSRLAAATGMHTWDSRRRHSVGFMSRLQVAHYEWHRPPEGRRSFLEIALVQPELRIFGIHLSAIHSNHMERRRVRELEATLASIARHRNGPHVLTGDFNTLAPGERLDLRRLPRRLRLLAWLFGRSIRWQTVQIMLDAGYVDGFRALHPNAKGPTFPTWGPHVRLDYLFVPANALSGLRSCEVLAAPDAVAASDHLPLLAELEM